MAIPDLGICKVKGDTKYIHYTWHENRFMINDDESVCGQPIYSFPHEWTTVSYQDRIKGVKDPFDRLYEISDWHNLPICPECQKIIRKNDKETGYACLY